MLIAGKNNGRFLKNKVTESFILSIPTTFITIIVAKNKYGGLYVPRCGAAIGSRGAEFVW